MSGHLQLNENVFYKGLSNGEMVLWNGENGVWIKTSVSFKQLMKKLQKGVDEEELLSSIPERRKEEVEKMIMALKNNGFLRGFTVQQKLNELKRLGYRRFLVEHPVFFKKAFYDFLYENFKDYEITIHCEADASNEIKEMDFLEKFKGSLNVKEIGLKVKWNKIISKELIDVLLRLKESLGAKVLLIIDFFDFEENEAGLKRKIEFLEDVSKKGVEIEMNYHITETARKNKRRPAIFISPPFVVPCDRYYFSCEEIFDKEKKDVFLRSFLKAIESFFRGLLIGEVTKREVYPENFLGMTVLSLFRKESCGAGKILFFVNSGGEIYPCKYLTKFSLGNVFEGSKIADNDLDVRSLKCKDCTKIMWRPMCSFI